MIIIKLTGCKFTVCINSWNSVGYIHNYVLYSGVTYFMGRIFFQILLFGSYPQKILTLEICSIKLGIFQYWYPVEEKISILAKFWMVAVCKIFPLQENLIYKREHYNFGELQTSSILKLIFSCTVCQFCNGFLSIHNDGCARKWINCKNWSC